jgi:hypothetical protein
MSTRICVILITVLICIGCVTISTGDPAITVEQYLQAKIEGNREMIQSLLCSVQEVNLEREVLSFSAVSAELQDANCTYDEDTSLVTCTGQIVADYGGENTVFPLGSYAVIQEDGQWKWCGEATLP